MSTEKITVDVGDFTLGEIEEFEELAGVPMSSLGENTPARAMTALVVIARRRTDPDFTVEQARQIRMSEVEVIGDKPDDPTSSSDGAGAAGSSRTSAGSRKRSATRPTSSGR